MSKNLYNIKADSSEFPPNDLKNKGKTFVEKHDHAKFIIERFDQYYDGVNSKGAFYIGLNTFIFGGICVGYLSLYNKIDPNLFIWILFAGIIISNALSIFLTVLATMPFLKNSYNKSELSSLVFFGGISKHNLAYFKEKFYRADESTMLDDLIQQVYCLATGLNSKYKKLKRASHLVVVQFIFMLPLLYLIIKNLKS